ncbi:FGGY family carbohydrate kinase [Gymnodinialimonas sp. 2305UL16-5]|uniref:FGGY-family carbohydrate kinase n=1 Tax=Gymnodinialimonas mytili TaxID=3126503 RepID=UPI0030A895A3
MAELWLGLDVGTTAVKAAAYAPDGIRLAEAQAPSPVSQYGEGRSEQDMNAVWASVCNVLSELGRQVDFSQAISLGICGQGDGLWPVDRHGQPSAPAMLWNDTRAAADLDALAQSGTVDVIGRGCHTALWTGTSGMLWRWLRVHDPKAAAKTVHVMTCADWIGLCLTGVQATDASNASIPFLDFQTRSYGPAQLAALDCADLAPKLLPLRAATEQMGKVTAQAAAQTGLPEGLPVSVGTLDLAAMIVGMGMDRAGQTMMIMGTTAVVNILTDHVEPIDTPVGASVLHPTSDVVIRVFAPTTGASAFDWFTGLHPQTLGGQSAGEIAGKLNALVQDVPPGSNGVIFLPYLNGERAPFVASDIRAGFHGLSASTSKAEMGRAVMEGAAFSLRHCFKAEGGLPTSPVQLTGGGSKNDTWCQIIADVMGQPVMVSDASDQGLWGVACIGAAAAGQGAPVALAKRTETHRTFIPNHETTLAYDQAFARYLILSEAARDVQTRLKSLQETAQ